MSDWLVGEVQDLIDAVWAEGISTEEAARNIVALIRDQKREMLALSIDAGHVHEFEDRCYCGELAHEYYTEGK